MSRNLVIALLLIALLIVLFIFNGGKVDVNLLAVKVPMMKSLAFLMFAAIGVVIGVLLK